MDIKDRNQHIENFLKTLRSESDRGSVIVAASLLDDVLAKLLKARLAPSLEKKDELFDDHSSPFSTFSARIDLAYRLGLLRPNARASLHQLRKIRNNFAHVSNPKGFDSDSTKSRIQELFKLNKNVVDEMSNLVNVKLGISRDEFLKNHRLILEVLFSFAAGFMLASIQDLETIEPLWD
ncbi:hypothetical protein BA894_10430 [Vibrio natriegens]|uniref:hypothetical protein n=1 Tax=Vibrio natriegens TaxID=691 RepID=UPI0008045176|nr:hypothetical protein [Vibrio natriegens]ANQ26844.1 hypothetical protein BA894_10430 [Vibrio natriegens]